MKDVTLRTEGLVRSMDNNGPMIPIEEIDFRT